VNDSKPEEKHEEDSQLIQQPYQRHTNQMKQEQDKEHLKELTVEHQTTIELQYQKEQEEHRLKQQQSTPEDKQPIEKQQVNNERHQDGYQNTEQTNVQQIQEQQSKENEKRQHASVCDKPNFYQLNKHIVSVNYAQTESKDKESLDSFKISPPPLRSRNLDNTATNCTETFVYPPLWTGIEPPAF
jgi:hypothetical protein